MPASQAYIALLRGINVGGNKLIPMADLRELLASLGLEEPRTLLQSGNAVFRAKIGMAGKLEQRIERAIATELDTTVDVIVRTAQQLGAAIDANPFAAEAARDPSRTLVGFAKSMIDPIRVDELRQAIVGRELVAGHGMELYFFYPDGAGRSKLTHALIEKKVGARVTARNWNTVLKLRDAAT